MKSKSQNVRREKDGWKNGIDTFEGYTRAKLENIEKTLAEINKQFESTHCRLRNLESFRDRVKGIFYIASTSIVFLGAVIFAFLKYYGG